MFYLLHCVFLSQGEQARDVLKLDVGEGSSEFAIDIRTEAAVVSLNVLSFPLNYMLSSLLLM